MGVSGTVHGALEWGGEGGEWEGCACGEGVRGEGGGCRADSECEGCGGVVIGGEVGRGGDSYLSISKAPGRDSNALVSRCRASVNGGVVLSS